MRRILMGAILLAIALVISVVLLNPFNQFITGNPDSIEPVNDEYPDMVVYYDSMGTWWADNHPGNEAPEFQSYLTMLHEIGEHDDAAIIEPSKSSE